MSKVRIRRNDIAKRFDMPAYQTDLAAGFDLRAAIEKPVVLGPGDRALVSTGISVQLEAGYEMQIRPRSGLALKNGITVLNSPGTVDADYTGDVGVILVNYGQYEFTVKPGDRIAQAIIATVAKAVIEEVDELEETERGSGGFGSTGVTDAHEMRFKQ